MPTYAYACKDCGHAFDIQQSFSEDSLTVCPECRGTLRKKFNSVGVVFKGSGFYRTDSRSTSSSVPAAATSGPSSSESGASTADAGSSNAGTTGTGSSSSSNAAKTPAKVSAGS
ncbi:FmdB family zinc ribbon protein [Specibacter sp. NPDC078709]|uniref:FmdB family zinc ribbon protein n=1 Tax=unclassified Specibacter TaxID=3081321 RepID=UPI00343474F5